MIALRPAYQPAFARRVRRLAVYTLAGVVAVGGLGRLRARTIVGADAATIRQADAVVRRRWPGASASARIMALAIGLLETGFGVSGSWLLDDGTPSYNWGGLVGSGTNGSLVHGDHAPDGTPVEYKFKAFRTMDDAFDAFYATWSHGDVKGIGHADVPHEPTVGPAAARGDASNVARTMYAHGYYGGVSGNADDRIAAYGKAIAGAAATVARALGEPNPVRYEAGGVGSGGPGWTGWLLVGAISGGLVWGTLHAKVA